MEIFTYWTAGGEADGLAAIEEVFAQQHPGIEVINAVIAGGAGSNANAVLATRMQGGDPPDTYQIHGGAELIDTWVKTGFTQSLADFYTQRGLNDKFPQGIIDLVSYEGAPYAVPVGVHRNGVLWNNAKVLADNGITAPTDWDSFFAAADKLKAAGITRSPWVTRTSGRTSTCSSRSCSASSAPTTIAASGRAPCPGRTRASPTP